MTIEEIIAQILENNPKADVELIRKAYHYADKAHEGQFRHSGEPYIIHPLAIAEILAGLGLDTATIAAGLLHDVVEDTDIDIEEIEEEFSSEIALLVDGVTKLSRLEYRSKELRQIESYRKMFLAMSKDIRVMLIKLADRMHNMRTLKHQDFWKQRDVAKETLEIFSPLASRLGIFKIKWELDDLSLRYLEPEKYYYLVEQISMKRKEREEFINQVIVKLEDEISDQANIEADISGRPKHFYSIYVKMEKDNKDLNEIYDLIAIRIIVNSVKDCYGALGIIHTLWKPIPGRFKDYIAMPKPNMYQSLHTSVIGPRGNPLEIQIRTWDMHRTAEYGIAAHWLYKESSKNKAPVDDQLTWLKQIKELQDDLPDSKEFMDTLKLDLFTDLVFVFSPQGDVYELPAGSTPIDFAYIVHTEIGHSCIGSKVNSRIVPLNYELKTGDIVEILTSKQATGPSRDWLKVVKSSQAKNKIRQWFKKEKKEVNLDAGRDALEKNLRKANLNEKDLTKADKLKNIGKKIGYHNHEDLLVAIGDGAVTTEQVILKLKDEYIKETKKDDKNTKNELEVLKESKKPSSSHNSQGVRIKGIDNVLVRFARCCNPLPGDRIIGFITRGRGVSIHRQDCPNVKVYELEEPERLLEAAWDEVEKNDFLVEIKIVALDRLRLTSEVMLIIGDSKTHINGINAWVKRGYAYIDVKITVNSLEELNGLIEKIRRVKDVVEVERITPSQGSTS